MLLFHHQIYHCAWQGTNWVIKMHRRYRKYVYETEKIEHSELRFVKD